MNAPHLERAQDIQWKLTIVQRNLAPDQWTELLTDAQEQMLREVMSLSDQLPAETYHGLMTMLEPLVQHTPHPLKADVQNMLAYHSARANQCPILTAIPSAQSWGSANRQSTLNLFIRQPFTESGQQQQQIIQGVLDQVQQVHHQHQPLNSLTGLEAQSQDTFRQAFEQTTGLRFTPSNFRRHRLQLLDQADAMLIVRTSLSESGAFEIAYNTFGGRRIPMFFAVWKQSPIKTTLLRELDEVCQATYVTFDHPDELLVPLMEFLATVPQQPPAWVGDRQVA